MILEDYFLSNQNDLPTAWDPQDGAVIQVGVFAVWPLPPLNHCPNSPAGYMPLGDLCEARLHRLGRLALSQETVGRSDRGTRTAPLPAPLLYILQGPGCMAIACV